ncbi:glycerophosphodiester phosphodiesterase [Phycicoccus flavus]|uniref:Glycerophosphodiester phosphodiesterase n=1 Tax=Phycicoccus flavus TaxID=2502783 RepID=A0A8T6R835_9MICO|nr:glycerophosphodiester phosphodiesterase family protein [Phycicoccus flavus]NHA70036.1 glycerophosphodiester phosphodiesterase [Phycicoccus flavus]
MTAAHRTSTARPVVVAHRGASADRPEHTLHAYEQALDDGAEGVECDVRLTADHHLVCVHDRRVDRTSNGTGRVSTLELARLEELDWASWKTPDGDAESPDADPERGRLLTLRRLLDTLCETRREVVTLIETKHPTRHGDDVEKTLVQVLRSFDLDDGDRPGRPHVRVMSFSSRALQRVHRLSPEVPLVHLVADRLPAKPIDGSLPAGVGTVGLDVRLVRRRPHVVQRFLDRGNDVFVWTVDDPEDVDLCLRLGVGAVITNRPAMAVDRVRATE